MKHLLPPMLALLLAGCSHSPRPAAPAQVGVVPVVQQDVPLVREWIANLDGFVNAEIRPQVEGYVLRQAYREGSAVRRGQTLFEIDPRAFRAAADQARAALARDKAARDKARLDVDRFTPLAAQKAISQQELDNAAAALRQAQAAVDASQAALDKAALNVEWTRVASPIDGVAGIAKVQMGDLVNGTRVMTTVSTLNPIKAYFSATEQDYRDWARDWAKGGGKGSLELVLSDGTVYPRRGDPLLADRGIDPRTGTILVAGTFPNPDGLLRPGQFGKVRAAVALARGALLVPQRAIWDLQGTSQVAVVGRDNRVDIRVVQTGAKAGPLVVIEKGLNPGERVVVEGTQKVASGQLVAPVPGK
ncbi:efflux RND transporter periplasmic adaptor subunit [Mesoterricola silvestris]|uniref:MexE family multidrug efflux RND transporter periplasmic adaptor subunit n=1 Tax=Mesoterricola silvestris TaxID=2927979 RepID=A0AA48H6C6_9BACT|nr:efflux RND transporter periplasmic adaptor subunit [Mesoterricola silvestris]BDU72663.1 MexE family multidrug efflux RND transporter periplasmic adaptor subunit [Mesoterricola silvestris]